MTLLIRAKDVEAVLLKMDPKAVMRRAIAAVDEAYKEAFREPSHNFHRRRITLHKGDSRQVRVGTFMGAVPNAGYMGLLVRSDEFQLTDKKIAYHEPFIRGYHVLYSTDNAEPLAIIYGGSGRDANRHLASVAAHTLRTSATTAVGTRAICRKGARSLGLFGAGFFAPGHLLSLATCFDLETIKVFSPTKKRREEVCSEMSQLLGQPVTPVERPEDAVVGSDIIVTVTSANSPVFDGNWLVPGQHFTGLVAENKEMFSSAGKVASGSARVGRREIDNTAISRAQLIVVNSKSGIEQEQQLTLCEPLDKGLITWDRIRELGDVLLDPPTRADDAITFYHNNAGQGVADVAIGGVLYEIARENGLGQELDF